jgi:hypothetical protein
MTIIPAHARIAVSLEVILTHLQTVRQDNFTLLPREKEHLMVQALWYLKNNDTYGHPIGKS